MLSLSVVFETARKTVYVFAIHVCPTYVAWNNNVIRYYMKYDGVFKIIKYETVVFIQRILMF